VPRFWTGIGQIHESVTIDRVIDAVHREMNTLDNPGFCIECGNEQEGCEPDARYYKCEACGQRKVFGATELMQHLI
jgi:hypothetical protein